MDKENASPNNIFFCDVKIINFLVVNSIHKNLKPNDVLFLTKCYTSELRIFISWMKINEPEAKKPLDIYNRIKNCPLLWLLVTGYFPPTTWGKRAHRHS